MTPKKQKKQGDRMTEEEKPTTKPAPKQTGPRFIPKPPAPNDCVIWTRDRIIYLLPIFIIVLIYGIGMVSPSVQRLYNYDLGNVEDGIFEWTQFLCYAIASIVGFRIFLLIRIRDKWIAYGWLLFAAACLLAAGEEISWAERLGGLSLDPIRSINVQKETNIHNLKMVQDKLHILYVIAGFSLALGRRVFPKLLFLPAERLSLFFLIPGLWYLAFFLYDGGMPNHQELYELILALGFSIHAVSSLRSVR